MPLAIDFERKSEMNSSHITEQGLAIIDIKTFPPSHPNINFDEPSVSADLWPCVQHKICGKAGHPKESANPRNKKTNSQMTLPPSIAADTLFNIESEC